MNICFSIISDTWAGAETVVYELAKHLRNRGENILIVLNREIYDHYSSLEDVHLLNLGSLFNYRGLVTACISAQVGADEKRVPVNTFPSSFYVNASLREVYYKRARSRLAKIMQLHEIQVIHSHLNAGIALVSNFQDDLEIPVIATLHGQSVAGMARKSPISWLTSPVGSWRRERLRKALHKARTVTAVSTAEIEAVENCDIYIKDKTVVIPNGININEIQSEISSTPLKGKFNLLFPGGARLIKGGDLIVQAMPKIKAAIGNVHLYIAGDVRDNHPLRKMVSAIGLDESVTFTGLIGVKEYRQLLNSADLLVMPSRDESFGIAFLEAMALGKPVVGSNIGGIPSIVKDRRNGILVEPVPDKIADTIIHLYMNTDLQREMSCNNLGDVMSFDWRDIVETYLDVYNTAIRG